MILFLVLTVVFGVLVAQEHRVAPQMEPDSLKATIALSAVYLAFVIAFVK